MNGIFYFLEPGNDCPKVKSAVGDKREALRRQNSFAIQLIRISEDVFVFHKWEKGSYEKHVGDNQVEERTSQTEFFNKQNRISRQKHQGGRLNKDGDGEQK